MTIGSGFSGSFESTRPVGAGQLTLNADDTHLNYLNVNVVNLTDDVSYTGATIGTLSLNIAIDGYKLPDAGSDPGTVGNELINYVRTGRDVAAPYNHAAPLPYFISDLLFSPVPTWTPMIGERNPALTLTFSFMQSLPTAADSFDANGFQTLGPDLPAGYTPQQLLTANSKGTLTLTKAEVAALTALANWALVVDINYVSAADSETIDIRFGSNTQTNSGAYTYAPYNPLINGAKDPTRVDADIYISNSYNAWIHGFAHEIGHTVGLGGESGNGDPSDVLPFGEDDGAYTLMSYNGGGSNSPQPFDIAVADYLYGPNPNYHPNASHIWTFSSSGGVGNLISDGGGSLNSISAASTSQAAYIDLRPGHWSYLGGQAADILAANQLFIDYNVQVDAVSLGSGATTVVCNNDSDIVTCGGGTDLIVAGAGADAIVGGTGVDTVLFAYSIGNYTIMPGGGAGDVDHERLHHQHRCRSLRRARRLVHPIHPRHRRIGARLQGNGGLAEESELTRAAGTAIYRAGRDGAEVSRRRQEMVG